jgi:hypothetical protein
MPRGKLAHFTSPLDAGIARLADLIGRMLVLVSPDLAEAMDLRTFSLNKGASSLASSRYRAWIRRWTSAVAPRGSRIGC